jgi:hypothetical protein
METPVVESTRSATATAFEPTIIAFVCNWCTYTAADLAGTSRLSYPPMCGSFVSCAPGW